MVEYAGYKEVQNRKQKKYHPLVISQEQYELSLTKLIVHAMLPISFVAIPWFREYTHRK